VEQQLVSLPVKLWTSRAWNHRPDQLRDEFVVVPEVCLSYSGLVCNNNDNCDPIL
jgi:hypothetical protein